MTETAVRKPGIDLAKIVSTPTDNSWSQAYNAGNLFSVLSLTADIEGHKNLSPIGKEILKTLEEEYFILEEKNLNSIKEAAKKALEKVPDNFTVSFLVASTLENILYLVVSGHGRVILKREEKTGIILDTTKKKPEKADLSSASGFLEDNDLIVLETNQFVTTIQKEKLVSSLENNTPTDIAEILSPLIHGKEDGGAAAIILRYKKTPKINTETEEENNEELISAETSQQSEELISKKQNSFPIAKNINVPKILEKLKFPEIKVSFSRKIFLGIAFLLIALLFSGISLNTKKQEDSKTKAVFEKVFNEAQKKYDEGNALLSLNKSLARNDLLQAQKLLNENKPKFKEDSGEEKQILALLEKVDKLLNETSQVNLATAKETGQDSNPLLSYKLKNLSESYQTEDDNNLYSVDQKAIYSIDKSSRKKKTIIENENSWSEIGGIGTYLGNIYLLDRKSGQILKFVATNKDYGKRDYFASSGSIDLSKTQSIAIDGSIYILSEDGSVLKFTKGKQEGFKITGLDFPFQKPTRIFTDSETNNIYILDPLNSRIVVLNKDGLYQSQYSAAILKTAGDFDILEKDKKIYVLSENKIWEIEMK